MGDILDVYRVLREERQERRAKRLPVRTDEILKLAEHGYTVKKLTDYQFRVNDRLDLYPTRRRYHDTKTHRRGAYRTPLAIAERILGKVEVRHG